MRRGLVWSLIFMIGAAAASIAAVVALSKSPLLGLDLKGGVSVVLQPQGTASDSELQEAVNIIERRVNGLGVSNSNVSRQGHDVVISLPGIKNAQQALAELGQTATLYFRPVYCEIPNYQAPPATATPKPSTTPSTATPATDTPATGTSPTTKATALAPPDGSARLTSAQLSVSASAAAATATTTATTPPTTAPSSTTTTVPASPAVSQTDCSASNASTLPTTPVSQDNGTASVILPDRKQGFRYVLGPADMTGSEVSNAIVQVDPSTGQYSVALSLKSAGAKKFDQIATARYQCYQQNTASPPSCSQEAFELDGVVESAPTFQASSFNGNVQITGSFTSSDANRLALVLKYGSLPVRFVPQSVQTVSATIGKDSLHAGLAAGVGGLIIVLLYMIVYYRLLGLVVLVGLGVGGAILYSIITLLGQTNGLTLTLAGVTGIIVSIGITVDSYVVYFERLKDEVRAGRTVRQSVERSFSRAFKTVLTADLVSFMAALILYLLSIGDVRGFAFMLGLSTLLDVVTAYLFIRPAVILVGRRRSFTDNPVFGIARGLGARRATAGEA
ncbi:MAG: protein translocase subunit SecD [Acidimicrobiales bacterium]|nr:protein translocase subunit SecD [Acidimicrobiales bacterium]